MKRLVPLALAAALLANSGCHIFSKNKNPVAPKESKNLATDTEKDFMLRWIDKRTGELEAKGMGVDAAHAQAVVDYKTSFSYTKTVQQAH
jgi:hypothetical protein